MANQILTVSQLTADGFIESMASSIGDCTVVLDDGSKVVMPIRLALINGIFWTVHRELKVPVDKSHIFWVDAITDETTTDFGTSIYREFVLVRKLPHLKVLGSIWCAINHCFTFIHSNCREYQISLDALMLARMCAQPELKEICERRIDERMGTREGEHVHTEITDDLHKLLQSGRLEYNPLQQFMRTKLLKRNQLPQMFCSYGPRSDIDDTMFKHIISANAFSGLEDVFDYATEYSSAKKAQYFNTGVIRVAQYFARRMRLGASRIPYIYPGSCGSTFTLPVLLKEKYAGNYIGKYIKVTPEEFEKYDDIKLHMFNDCSIELTKKNIKHFIGKTINMWSPFGCKYTDGICEHCAGYMSQHAIAFMPPDIQAGVCTATHLSSVITQKILSAKHLIKTSSKEYVLNQIAMKYFSKNTDVLFWQASAVNVVKKSWIRISVDSIGTPSDLQHETLPTGESWSRNIDNIQLIGSNGNVIDDICLTDDTTHPFFSNYAMSYMRDRFKDLRIRSEYIDVPMDKYDFKKPLLKFTPVNDDMVSYVTSVDKFLRSKICDYHSIGKCLEDFSELVYSKSGINIFFIELMLRAFLVTVGGKDHSIPVITDPNQLVEFDKMSSMISESALSTKLSFERLEELFNQPEPTLYDRGSGYGFNDAHYGYLRLKN